MYRNGTHAVCWNRHLTLTTEHVPDQCADRRAKSERNPQLHAEKLCAAQVCASRRASRHVSDARHGSLYFVEQPLYFSSPALVVELVDTLS